MEENICCSGGAEGSDLQFGESASSKKHYVIHYIFDNHPRNYQDTANPYVTNLILSKEDLSFADKHLYMANKSLKRTWPTKLNFTNNLLRRNWFQVKDSTSLYAVSTFDGNGNVLGGTAWAVQMFIDKYSGNECEAYVFDQELLFWNKWNGWYWEEVKTKKVPKPKGTYAGIGTRNINSEGRQAINDLYRI